MKWLFGLTELGWFYESTYVCVSVCMFVFLSCHWIFMKFARNWPSLISQETIWLSGRNGHSTRIWWENLVHWFVCFCILYLNLFSQMCPTSFSIFHLTWEWSELLVYQISDIAGFWSYYPKSAEFGPKWAAYEPLFLWNLLHIIFLYFSQKCNF